MALHDVVIGVLNARSQSMTAREIADEIANRKLFQQKNGTPMNVSQISMRIDNYPELFVKKGHGVALKMWNR
jgi:hypothetical protein